MYIWMNLCFQHCVLALQCRDESIKNVYLFLLCMYHTLKKVYVGGLYIISHFLISFQQIDEEEMREDAWKVQW